jgi:hypothetical protein
MKVKTRIFMTIKYNALLRPVDVCSITDTYISSHGNFHKPLKCISVGYLECSEQKYIYAVSTK